jgi:putative PIN family toxin of toxin-antitoxin system
MRVVFDTNILTRAVASPSGPAGELFERVASDHLIIASLELLAELSRVLSYERLRRLHRLSDESIDVFIEGIESGATLVRLPNLLPRIVPYDVDDDLVVAIAVAGRADVLCTRNRHLFHENVVAYCRDRAIEVMDDLKLLQKVREEHA